MNRQDWPRQTARTRRGSLQAATGPGAAERLRSELAAWGNERRGDAAVVEAVHRLIESFVRFTAEEVRPLVH